METKIVIVRGTLEEVEAEFNRRTGQGFDGSVCEHGDGTWSLRGTPEEWYEKPGNTPDDGILYQA